MVRKRSFFSQGRCNEQRQSGGRVLITSMGPMSLLCVFKRSSRHLSLAVSRFSNTATFTIQSYSSTSPDVVTFVPSFSTLLMVHISLYEKTTTTTTTNIHKKKKSLDSIDGSISESSVPYLKGEPAIKSGGRCKRQRWRYTKA